MRRTVLTLVLLGLAVIIGCQTRPQTEERSPGESLFQSRCITCHRLPRPSQKTAPEWTAWLSQHSKKAGLGDTELEQILSYLSGPGGN